MMKKHHASAGLALLCLALSACSLAPHYQPPELQLPEQWTGQGTDQATTALPADWWTLYKDPVLERLENQAMANNPDLQATAERFQQARDVMMQSRSRLMPQVIVGFGAVPNLVSWEPDIWSEIRNETRAKKRESQRKAAEYAAARLSLQAEIAHDYFALRGLDAQDANYRKAIDYYRKSLDIIQIRVAGLISPELDAARARELLYNTEAEWRDIQAQRQVMEHALAILVNVAPSEFHVPAAATNASTLIPHVPTSVPSTLLKHRPDIAGAERLMAQANAEIGAARATFFPNVSVKAGGYDEEHGVGVEWPIFTGGARRAATDQAWSKYREATDRYRATVLNAFREVEDGLSRVDRLSVELNSQKQAVEAARQTQNMTMDLYKGGLNTSLDLIVSQVNTLETSTREVRIKTELLQASAELIRALGGGWSRSNLPGQEQIQPFGTLEYGHLANANPVRDVRLDTDSDTGRDLTDGGNSREIRLP